MDILEQAWRLIVENAALIVALLGSPVLVAAGTRIAAIFQLRRVHLVTRADDPVIDLIEQVQRLHFPEEELDSPGLLAERIAASKFDMFKKPRAESAVILIYYRRRGKIHGYLSAEYFKKTRTIFFWYLVNVEISGKRRVERQGTADGEMEATAIAHDTKAAVKLIQKLSRVCNGINGSWRQIVAEVDATSAHKAIPRLKMFQRYAKSLARQAGNRNPLRWLFGAKKPGAPQVFKVDVPFKMPLHEAGFLFEAEKHETPAWLVFAPQDPSQLQMQDGRCSLPRARVDEMLETLRLSYQNADDPEYNRYIDGFYARLSQGLPEQCPLISRGSEFGASQRAARRRPVKTAAATSLE